MYLKTLATALLSYVELPRSLTETQVVHSAQNIKDNV
jgi:hypothetical protein